MTFSILTLLFFQYNEIIKELNIVFSQSNFFNSNEANSFPTFIMYPFYYIGIFLYFIKKRK